MAKMIKNIKVLENKCGNECTHWNNEDEDCETYTPSQCLNFRRLNDGKCPAFVPIDIVR